MSEVKKIKPALSKGTRDFLPAEVAKRNYIFETIKSVFRKYGFEQIETPAIERLETLTGKYGEEGDKLLFKILNSGDIFSSLDKRDYDILRERELREGLESPIENLGKEEQFGRKITSAFDSVAKKFTEKGLRYDLTVPLARYVVQHQDELAFPFKRFHIGPVWRADRPQKGRYQEFYQCDADVIGSTSLLNEVELTKIYLEVFEKLGIEVIIQMNHRKILYGIATAMGYADRFLEFATIADKLDKIHYEGFIQELKQANFNVDLLTSQGLFAYNFFNGRDSTPKPWVESISELKSFLASYQDEVQDAINQFEKVNSHFVSASQLSFNPFLVRGLNYYTGIIWEVVCKNVQMGSIASGGRYDNLTEMFGGQNMSGVGISFGIERIYDVMEELNLFPDTISQGVKVLFVPREDSSEEFCFRQAQHLRDIEISSEVFLGKKKKGKHFDYAKAKKIEFVAEIGADEEVSGTFRLKNMESGNEEKDDQGNPRRFTIEQIIAKLK